MHITNILGSLQLIVAALQATPDYYTNLVPVKYHVAFHSALGLATLVIWAIQRDFNREGQKVN